MKTVELDYVFDSPGYRGLLRLLAAHTDDVGVIEALYHVPDLAFLILAEANSLAYSGGTPIATLERAVVLLGRRAILDLARSVPLRNLEESAIAPIWACQVVHGVAVGTAAAMMARAAQLPLEEEARTLGIIHDIGMQILLERDPVSYEKALSAAAATSSRVVDHERFHCGTDHGEVAENLLRQAGLPETMCAAVGYHHDPLSAPTEHRYLSTLLFAAECLARRAGQVDFCGNDSELLEPRILATLRIGNGVIEAYVPLFKAELQRLGIRPNECRTRSRNCT